jgi:hypothetical protein
VRGGKPGDEQRGTWEAAVNGLDDGPEHQRYWLAVACEIALHARGRRGDGPIGQLETQPAAATLFE